MQSFRCLRASLEYRIAGRPLRSRTKDRNYCAARAFGPPSRPTSAPARHRNETVCPLFPRSKETHDRRRCCAGAGGKTLAFADYLGGKGRVYAYDTSEKKLQALRRRGRLAGYNSIQTAPIAEGKEEEMSTKFAGRADVVLIDAPCSGWGVLRRNPDSKWKQTRAELDRLPLVQEILLSSYAKLVRTDGTGRLVYAVCTFRPRKPAGLWEIFGVSDRAGISGRIGRLLGTRSLRRIFRPGL